MDLDSGYPFWAVRSGLRHAFPPLARDLRCDVAVVGGGISGALVADELAKHGHDVAVLDRRDIAWGSTAASTALVQYEIDTPLRELEALVGADDAALAYRACAEAIPALARIARPLRHVDFAHALSLYLPSRAADVAELKDELVRRERIGLAVHWLSRAALRERYGLVAPGALASDCAAQVDPYRLTGDLLARWRKRGVAVHDRTTVTAIEPHPRGVVLRTDRDATVLAKHVVVAAGYEAQCWLAGEALACNRSTYCYVTDPLGDALGPLARTLVWETARPYLYLRSTPDGRLLVGGADDAVDVPARRDARYEAKARTLQSRLRKLLPGLDARPTFAWAGTFAETRDGLPWFGPHPRHGPRVQFALAYGGNGITYAVIGAALLRANLERRRHPLAALFGFGRELRAARRTPR